MGKSKEGDNWVVVDFEIKEGLPDWVWKEATEDGVIVDLGSLIFRRWFFEKTQEIERKHPDLREPSSRL